MIPARLHKLARVIESGEVRVVRLSPETYLVWRSIYRTGTNTIDWERIVG